jgi:hypothetical protein
MHLVLCIRIALQSITEPYGCTNRAALVPEPLQYEVNDPVQKYIGIASPFVVFIISHQAFGVFEKN